ncbi:MAG: DUF4340 domain-containing protein [Myxococcales bacterium]|nr:DUF4340 domain-containing protein [Myxococcales bacterium]
MRARGAAIQGGLATVGLVLAYTTWQREPERAPGEVVVLEATQNEIAKVRYEEGAKWVELEKRADGVWLRTSPKEPPKTPERELHGNENADKLLGKFAPLRASRALGVMAADKLKELGLDAPKKKLEITARGSKVVFSIGASPYGVSDPYVKDERDGRVFVLSGSTLSDLDSAALRLVDRTVHTFQPSEFDGLTLTAGGKTRELVQTNPENVLAAKLASKKTPDKPDDLARNWHDKVWRMVVVDVLGKGEVPAAGAPSVAARIEYTLHGKSRGFVELGKTTVAVLPGAPGSGTEVYLRTEHTAGWVKVPATAEEILKEAEKVAATE